MSGYSKEILSRVRDATDIVEVISESVLLKKVGANYKGLCPFHEEKTPSFHVHPGKQIFHCFGCGRGGDVFKFLTLRRNVTFPEAVQFLAGRAGISLPRLAPAPSQDDTAAQARKEVREINALAAAFYRDALASRAGAQARKYLADRGISAGSIEAFGLGFAPPGWRSLLEHLGSRGVPPQRAAAAGLARPKSAREGYYDVFRGRIVFPIFSSDGTVAGFGGRTFDGGEEGTKEGAIPKYLNSPDTALFKKTQILYGFPQAKEEIRRIRSALVVEGYFDVIALHQHGFANAVASMGTALAPEHVRLLRREGFCESLVLCFDPDAAGEGAARRGGTMLLDQYQQAAVPERWRGGQELTTLLGRGGDGSRMGLQVVALPAGEDADSFVRSRGAESFRGLLERAENLIDYLLNRFVAACPSDAPVQRRLETLREAVAVLSGQREAVRREYVRVLSQRLRIDEDLAERALRGGGRREPGVQATVEVRARTEKAPPAERALVQLLLKHPEIAGRLEIPLECFSDERLRRAAKAALEHAAAPRSGRSAEAELVQAVIGAVRDRDAEAWVTALSLEPGGLEDPERAALDCIARVREAEWMRRKAEWYPRLEEAKRRGDPEAVEALLVEGEALSKEKADLLRKGTRVEGFMETSAG